MSKEICQVCMGTGEGLYMSSSFGPDSEESYLADCNSCRGSGFKRSSWSSVQPKKKGNDNALEMAVMTILTAIQSRGGRT